MVKNNTHILMESLQATFSSGMTSSALLMVCRHQQRSHNKRGLTSASSSVSDLISEWQRGSVHTNESIWEAEIFLHMNQCQGTPQNGGYSGCWFNPCEVLTLIRVWLMCDLWHRCSTNRPCCNPDPQSIFHNLYALNKKKLPLISRNKLYELRLSVCLSVDIYLYICFLMSFVIK